MISMKLNYQQNIHILLQMMLHNKKKAGPDGIKSDLSKFLGNDTHCINILTDAMDKIIQKENDIPASWNTSKTVLVPKKKPTVKYLRPIALTNATYKLFMGILKTKN